jgi:hypothetical protein
MRLEMIQKRNPATEANITAEEYDFMNVGKKNMRSMNMKLKKLK